MVKPNENFNLTVKELALIEIALLTLKFTNKNRQEECTNLLAKFYHQKVWYRPKDEKIYVSGQERDMAEDFDFGFSLVDESELEAVQQATTQATTASQTATEMQSKIDRLYNMVMPLLNNLQQNPEKEYIYWPNRVDKIELFRDKLQAVYKS